MALIVTRPSVRETTLGAVFAIGELATQTIGTTLATIRTFPAYAVTTGAATTANDETIQLAFVPTAAQTADSITTFYLDAGTILDFSGTKVTVAEGITLTTSQQAVETLPQPGAIASAANASTTGALFVVGCSEANVAPEIKTSDATNYLSGIGQEMVVTGNAKTLSITTQLIYSDKGGNLLRKMAYDKTYVGREFYYEVTYPSGEKHQGIALVTSATPENTAQELRSFTLDAMTQGDTYVYTESTVGA